MYEHPLHVLLIHGNEKRFWLETANFYAFLSQEVGIPKDLITNVPFVSNQHQTIDTIESFFLKLPKFRTVDIAVVYSGHGLSGEFLPNEIPFTYEAFAVYFDVKGDFIFVNNCCYSGSCIDTFLNESLLPDKGLVIASSRHNQKSYDNKFLEALKRAYRNGREYKPKQLGRRYVIEKRKSKTKSSIDQQKWDYYNNLWVEIIRDERQNPVRCGKSLDHLLFTNQ